MQSLARQALTLTLTLILTLIGGVQSVSRQIYML